MAVDEIEDETCVLSITEWPRVDKGGRLRFQLGQRPHLIRFSTSELETHLGKRRSPKSTRKLRIGDVFAVRILKGRLPEPESEEEAVSLTAVKTTPESYFKSPLYDITAEAREEAKAALYASVAPTITKAQMTRLRRAPARSAG